MREFGRSNGGGRRSAPRSALPLTAVYSTISKSASGPVVDISCTGVRLGGSYIPSKGESVEITIDAIRAFGVVAWATNAQFAIAFDSELAPFEVDGVRRRAGMLLLTTMPPEERQAVEDWLLCVSR